MNTKKKREKDNAVSNKELSKEIIEKNEHMKKKSDHKIVKKNTNKKPRKKPTRSRNLKKHKTRRRKKSFGSLKTNTELPVQRWWFKSTPMLRTINFFYC